MEGKTTVRDGDHMRYLHVISTMDPQAGGPCQGIRNLTAHTHELGHHVEVVCLDDPATTYLAQTSSEQRATSSEAQQEEVGSQKSVVRGPRSAASSKPSARSSLKIHALGKGRGPWAYHPALRPWLEANVHRFDAIILNGLWQYPGFVLSQLARKLGDKMPPYCVYPHGMLDPWFQRAPERRLKAMRNWIYWKLIERHVIARAAAVLFTCAEELRLAQNTFWPYRPQRQVNVGYGVDQPPAFHERMTAAFAEKCPELQGRPYLLFLSRIHEKKGIGLLLHAYAQQYGSPDHGTTDHEPQATPTEAPPPPSLAGAPASSPASGSPLAARCSPPPSGLKPQVSGSSASDLRPPSADLCSSSPSSVVSGPPPTPALVIAGPGLDTEYGRRMQRLAADLRPSRGDNGLRSTDDETKVSGQWSVVSGQKMAPAIFFPGMLTGDAKWGAFYGCEAFVLPSHQENFGIAVAEALACGKPVLISNQINIWREIAEDGAGLVEADTAEGIHKLLGRWRVLSPADKAAMGHAARASFENRFGVAKAARNLSATLKEITGKK